MANNKNKKTMHLYAIATMVEQACYEKLNGEGWVIGVYPSFAVVQTGTGENVDMIKIPYTINESTNSVIISDEIDWSKVVNEWKDIDENDDPENEEGMVVTLSNAPMKTWKEGDVGHVQALGIRFSDASEKDLENNYFSKNTNFGPSRGHNAVAALNHRIPLITSSTKTSKEVQVLTEAANRIFTYPVKAFDDPDGLGIIACHALDLKNRYEKYIFDLTEQGVFSWSSSSSPHLVDVDEDGHIKTWIISEWSYTPTPCEPRLPSILPAKSLTNKLEEINLSNNENDGSENENDPANDDGQNGFVDAGKLKGNHSPEMAKSVKSKNGANNENDESPIRESEDDKNESLKTVNADVGNENENSDYDNKVGGSENEPDNDNNQKRINIKMTDEKNVYQDQLDKVRDELKVSIGEQGDQIQSVTKSIADLVEMIEGLPGREKAGYSTDDGGTADSHSKSFGDFLVAVKRKDAKRLKSVYGKALTEGDGDSGGYLVPDEYASTLLQITPETSPILSRVNRIPVSTASGDWPALDQYFAPTAGVGQTALAGGVTTASTQEMGTLTETEPTFEMLNWRVHKIGGFSQVSNELLNDSPMAIEALLRGLFNVAINAKMEYYILRGSGAGEPLGILNSDALVDVTPSSDNNFTWTDAITMQSRFKQVGTAAPVWIVHPSLWPDVYNMEIGSAGSGAFVANMQAAQNKNLLGYQIIQSEHLPQANSSGDAILADLSAYLLFDRQSVMIDFSEHYGFLTDSGTWRFTQRVDGMPWLQSPITLAGPGSAFTQSAFVNHDD